MLVFNTTGGRSGTDLLRPLVDPTMWQKNGGGGGASDRLFDVALFVPNDSSLVALPSAAATPEGGTAPPGGAAVAESYQWQGELLGAWMALDAQCWPGRPQAAAGAPHHLACVNQEQVQSLIVDAAHQPAAARLAPPRLAAPLARVAESIYAALAGVAAAAASLGRPKIHLFCKCN